jgi:hypothetical protein
MNVGHKGEVVEGDRGLTDEPDDRLGQVASDFHDEVEIKALINHSKINDLKKPGGLLRLRTGKMNRIHTLVQGVNRFGSLQSSSQEIRDGHDGIHTFHQHALHLLNMPVIPS